MSDMVEIPQKQTYLAGVRHEAAAPVTKQDMLVAGLAAQGVEFNSTYKQVVQEGMRGTLLPSSTGDTGGSAGFDPREKLAVTVHDLDRGASFVVPAGMDIDVKGIPVAKDREKLTQERRREISGALEQQVQDALKKAESLPAPSMEGVDVGIPAGVDLSGILAALPGVAAPLQNLRELYPRDNPPQAEIQHDPALRPVVGPTKRIVFDFGGAMGRMETYYHDIVRNGRCLVLCWDTAWTGPRYLPGFSPVESIKVIVGKEQEQFGVRSMGIQFTVPKHRLELTVLIVDNGEKAAEPESDTSLGMDIHGLGGLGGFGGANGEVEFM